MQRFLAICIEPSHGEDEAARLSSTWNRLRAADAAWLPAHVSGSFQLWIRGEQCQATVGRCRSLYLVGRAFAAPDGAWDACKSASAPVDVVDDGRGFDYLLTHCWGGYVAFEFDALRNTTRVLRDPSGGQRCLLHQQGAISYCASHADDLALIATTPIAIDWDSIAAHLWFDRVQVRRTSLSNVEAILPGECVDLAGHRRRWFAWSPHDFLPREADPASTSPADALRGRVHSVVRTHGRCQQGILHMLSGGLDSAIVATCLANDPRHPPIHCITHHAGGGGDERTYASTIADGLDLPLTEHRKEGTRLDRRALESGVAGSRPARDIFAAADTHWFELETAASCGATAIFTGQGGDHLFFYAPTSLAIADMARSANLSHTMGQLRRYAIHNRESVWHAMRLACWNGCARRPIDPFAFLDSRATLMPRQARERVSLDDMIHPWIASTGIPPGKHRQIFDLVDCYNFHESNGRSQSIDVVHPLISQPIIEFCLGVPTRLLAQGGVNRSLARRAFSGDLPSLIVNRLSKGNMTSYYHHVLASSLPFAREYLLGGLLRKERLIDPAQLETALSARGILSGTTTGEVLTALCVEAWSRAWTRKLSSHDSTN